MTPFSIAGVQTTVSATHGNVAAMASNIDPVMTPFSELIPYGPMPSNCPQSLAETECSFREPARRHGIRPISGSMFVREAGRLYNDAIVIDPDGDIVALTDPGEGASIHRNKTTAGSSGGVD